MSTMQPSKARSGSSEVPQKTSPRTPRTTRQPKVAVPECDSATSRRSTARTPTEKSSPKPIDRKTPKSPASEKKRVSRVSELESQLIQAQEDLKKTKELLSSCESCKKQALEEADDAKKQYSAMAADLEDAKRKLMELSGSEGPRFEELQKLSQECDRALQLELEALKKQKSVDAAALVSAMGEIQKLKLQIETIVESEVAQAKQAEQAHRELEVLKQDMVETISLVGTLRAELNDYEKSEAEHEELLSETQMQLQVAHATIKTLHSDGLGEIDFLKSVSSELETSKIQITTLKDNINAVYSEVECLRSELKEAENRLEEEHVKSMMQIRSAEDIASTLRSEVEQLKSALEEAETKLEEERIKNTTQPQSSCELPNSVKSESGQQKLAQQQDNEKIEELREDLIEKESELQRILNFNERLKEEIKSLRSSEPVSEMESKLMMSMAEVAELKSKLMDRETELRVSLTHKETELQRISCLNERLKEEILRLTAIPTEPKRESKLEMSMTEVTELKANLMDKETELQGIAEENMVLKEEIVKRVEEMHKSIESATAELEAAKASEQAALTRLGHATEEAEKNSRRAAIVADQLEAAQTTNREIETELKRLRIQSEQWRKAAEAAASILATGNNGKLMERTGSLDSDYLHYGGNLMSSPYSDDMDEDSPKKKKNVLKKLGVLWKKGQK